ncbi:hypothetical protein FSP39_010885 [Pinctada imbricata]|uniref:Uncharacterized protein n=1 Tax=Pinctada imbricata TaxID=66713 RepID=A0AA88YWV6_PINIB|nr:hypothetical protein FSP39_010885 [Pinctada imbricata]
MGISVALVVVVIAGVIALGSTYPFHASCKLDWTVSTNCSAAMTAIENQFTAWADDSNCPQHDNERCFYTLKSKNGDTIKGTHKTPVKEYVDDLTFTFTTSGQSCKIHGFSTSETWYAVLDYSTNYCNLHNLAEGAGLTKMAGFTETTSDSICTQYSSRNCDKY